MEAMLPIRATFACVAFTAFASLGTGCAVSDASVDESSEAISTSYAPIAPAFKADANDASYAASMKSTVLPFCLPFESHGGKTFTEGTFGHVTFGKFVGAAGKHIAYGVYRAPNERAAMLLVPGRTEPFAKYCELVYDLRNSGISVYAMDIRGQGWSDRMLPDPQKGYVDSFDNYVADIKTFHDGVYSQAAHGKRILFGHSTGGGAATLYLEKYHSDFDAAILHSPMHEINTGSYPYWFAEGLASTLDFFGDGAGYAPGDHGYDQVAAFATNGCAHSPERWTETRTLVAQFPELAIGGPTINWVKESFSATKRMKANAGQIATPYLLLQAQQDEIVVPAAQTQICNASARYCEKHTFGDPSLTAKQCDAALKSSDWATANRCAGHELLMERDTIRAGVESAMSSFVDEVTGVRR